MDATAQTDGGWFSVNMGPIHLVALSSEHTGENKWSPCRGCGDKQVRSLNNALTLRAPRLVTESPPL